MEQNFKIITPVYNSEEWIGKCIQSVKDQTHKDFIQVIVDDCSTDNTVEEVKKVIGEDKRFILIENGVRVGVPLNQKRGVESLLRNPEDIIVHLDGDDWFYNEHTLAKVALVYDESSCWLTYGSYKSTNGKEEVAREYSNNPRQAVLDGWPFSHLRTFKRHCWDHLNEEDFISSSGHYYTTAADVVIFVPILERIGYNRVRFIEDILVTYNITSNNENKTNLQGQIQTALDVIRK